MSLHRSADTMQSTLWLRERSAEARQQLRMSLANSRQPSSIVKSTALLSSTYLPGQLQPTWPETRREWKEPAS